MIQASGSVAGVTAYAKTLPDVVYAGENLFTCSQDTQETMKELIDEYKLNRVVVSSCSPSTHEPLFQETIREAGLNPYLFNMANIRNQCSWVHRAEPAKATEKAKILTRIAVGKARLLKALHTIALDVTQKGLVVGGGLVGMTAALSIADQGFEVALVEREKVLGGNLRSLTKRPDGRNVAEYLDELIKRIEEHPRLTVYLNSTVSAIDGYIGNYLTSIESSNTGGDRGVRKEYRPLDRGRMNLLLSTYQVRGESCQAVPGIRKPFVTLTGSDHRMYTQFK